MPYMTGLEFARHVRAVRPDIPLVLTTGHLTPETEADMGAIGFNGVALKASTTESLEEVIAQAVRPHTST